MSREGLPTCSYFYSIFAKKRNRNRHFKCINSINLCLEIVVKCYHIVFPKKSLFPLNSINLPLSSAVQCASSW